MKKKIGEVFEWNGVELTVEISTDGSCTSCYFDTMDSCSRVAFVDLIGTCYSGKTPLILKLNE